MYPGMSGDYSVVGAKSMLIVKRFIGFLAGYVTYLMSCRVMLRQLFFFLRVQPIK